MSGLQGWNVNKKIHDLTSFNLLKKYNNRQLVAANKCNCRKSSTEVKSWGFMFCSIFHIYSKIVCAWQLHSFSSIWGYSRYNRPQCVSSIISFPEAWTHAGFDSCVRITLVNICMSCTTYCWLNYDMHMHSVINNFCSRHHVWNQWTI